MTTIPCVLTIAGSDSSGGAGIQADIKAISAVGCYAASAITAITVQNTQCVENVYALPDHIVAQQIEIVMSDLNIDAVKIGMLFNAEIISAVAQALRKFQPRHIVLDPVMIAKSGCKLLEDNAIEKMKSELFPLCTLITPNIHEAEWLLGAKIKDLADMESATIALNQQYQTAILLKGGHLASANATDILCQQNSCQRFASPRINSKNTHGTGCTLSATIAAYLAQNLSMSAAINAAKHYLFNALKAADDFAIGHGNGPVDHFYFRSHIDHVI